LDAQVPGKKLGVMNGWMNGWKDEWMREWMDNIWPQAGVLKMLWDFEFVVTFSPSCQETEPFNKSVECLKILSKIIGWNNSQDIKKSKI